MCGGHESGAPGARSDRRRHPRRPRDHRSQRRAVRSGTGSAGAAHLSDPVRRRLGPADAGLARSVGDRLVTVYAPAYRLRVYAPKSVDRTELTVLTPAASAPHSDAFQVATIPGVPGYQPYLDVPRGRRGKLDILQKRMDGGELTFTLVDRRVPTSGSNLARWVTGFTGNVKGRWQLAGFRIPGEARDPEIGRAHV